MGIRWNSEEKRRWGEEGGRGRMVGRRQRCAGGALIRMLPRAALHTGARGKSRGGKTRTEREKETKEQREDGGWRHSCMERRKKRRTRMEGEGGQSDRMEGGEGFGLSHKEERNKGWTERERETGREIEMKTEREVFSQPRHQCECGLPL